MSSSTVSDVLTRISAIQQQIASLQNGAVLGSQQGVAGGVSTLASGSQASAPASSGSSSSTGTAAAAATFANQLAQAQQGGAMPPAGGAATGYNGLSAASPSLSGLMASGLGSGSLNGISLGAGGISLGAAAPAAASAVATGGVALPAGASMSLTPAQQQFASTLSADTGLNPGVVTAWLLAEESGSAAQSRAAAGNNDWLNIGYTDSGTYGSSDPVWSDPTTAANATAAWMRGQSSIAGYGTASPGIQAILSTVGQDPTAQIQAIQQSGWASGGYPSLGSLYGQVSGT